MEIFDMVFRRKKLLEYEIVIDENLITANIKAIKSNKDLIKLWALYFCKVIDDIECGGQCREILSSSLKVILEEPFTSYTKCFELMGISKIINYSRISLDGDVKFTGSLFEQNKGIHLKCKFPKGINDTQVIASVFALLQHTINVCSPNRDENTILYNTGKNIYEIFSNPMNIIKQYGSSDDIAMRAYNKAVGILENGHELFEKETNEEFLKRKAEKLVKPVLDKSIDDTVDYCNTTIDENIENVGGEVILKLYFEYAIAYIHYFNNMAFTSKLKNRGEFMVLVLNNVVDNVLDKLRVYSGNPEYATTRKALTEHFHSSMVYYDSLKKLGLNSKLEPENPLFWNYAKQIISVVDKECSSDNTRVCSELFVESIKGFKFDEFLKNMNIED